MTTKILIAADHAGYEYKNMLVQHLSASTEYEVIDMGAASYDKNDDYPAIMAPVGLKVAEDPETLAIVFGGSGNGEAIVCNRFPAVRAAVYYGGNSDIVRLSREHNNANVLSLGARFMTFDEVKAAVDLWLTTPFKGEERHTRRIRQIDSIE